MMKSFGLLVFLIYMVLTIYIIPKQAFEFDLYRIKFRLLPHWYKVVALFWIIVSVVAVFIISSLMENWEKYLISSINLSLFVFLFSKQKQEDEFSQQIRFKALTYSFVYFIAIAGAFGTLDIQNKTGLILNMLNLHFLLGASILMALLYFYITLFKTRKSQ